MHWIADSCNGLLESFTRFLPNLARKRLHMPSRTVLYQPGDPMPYVFFPAGGVISVVVRHDNGECVQVSAVGAEGVAPVFALLGKRKSPLMLVQQVAGAVIRLPTESIARAMSEIEPLRSLVFDYLAWSLRAAHQATACNARHGSLARTAQMLLTTADRARSARFEMTQDVLAEMLGVPRQTANVAMREIARRQLVRVRRGQIELLDRAGLESVSCPCYPMMGERNWRAAG